MTNYVEISNKLCEKRVYSPDVSSHAFSKCSIRQHAEVPQGGNFMVNDIFYQLRRLGVCDPEVVEITELYVEPKERNKGHGSQLVNDIIRKHQESVIIVKAGALVSEYSDEPSQEEYDVLLPKLKRFYEALGFTDINFYVGYEYRVPLLYTGNEIGKAILNNVVKTQQRL